MHDWKKGHPQPFDQSFDTVQSNASAIRRIIDLILFIILLGKPLYECDCGFWKPYLTALSTRRRFTSVKRRRHLGDRRKQQLVGRECELRDGRRDATPPHRRPRRQRLRRRRRPRRPRRRNAATVAVVDEELDAGRGGGGGGGGRHGTLPHVDHFSPRQQT